MRLFILKVFLGDKTDYGYLYIKLSFWNRLKILFSPGIFVNLIGPDVYRKE